jgi:hypothetical protein
VTRTAEQLRADGWDEDEISEYRAGAASIGARVAELECRSAPTLEDAAPVPAPSETELQAQHWAAVALEQSNRRDVERRAEAMTKTRVIVERPDDPVQPEILRARALEHIMRDGVIIARPGPQNQPREMALRGADGEFQVFTAGAMPEMTLIVPATADAQERAWYEAARRREDQMLIAAWGLAECQRTGVLVTGATTAGEYAPPKLPPGVEAL